MNKQQNNQLRLVCNQYHLTNTFSPTFSFLLVTILAIAFLKATTSLNNQPHRCHDKPPQHSHTAGQKEEELLFIDPKVEK